MDKRKIKKGPSLLGRNVNNSNSNNKPDDFVKARKQSQTLSRNKARSQEQDSSMSRDSSPVLSGSFIEKNKDILTSTHLSSSNIDDNIITRKRLISVSPEQVLSSEELDESETFITVKKKKICKDVTQENRGKRLESNSPESDSPTSRLKTKERQIINNNNKNLANSSPDKLDAVVEKSDLRISRDSSVTYFSPDQEVSSGENPERESRLSPRKRVIGTQQSSLEKNVVSEKKSKRNFSGNLSKQIPDETESTDDDMFHEVSPAKKSNNRSLIASQAERTSGSRNSEKKNKNKDSVEKQKTVDLVRDSGTNRITSSQCAKKLPLGMNVTHDFKEFLERGGIVLVEDSPNLLFENWRTIVEKLNVLINSKEYDKEEIIKQFQHYIDDVDNLQSMLGQTMVHEEEALINENTESVARILLNVPSLQTGVSTSLLDRLAMAVLVEESPDNVPWSGALLRQFKFLEQIVDPVILVVKLEELLETAQKCFQNEIISYLPEIVIDAQHHTVGEVLGKLIDANPELTAVILDCISRLTLSKDYLEKIRDKTLNLLRGNPPQGALPIMTRFILAECSTQEARIKALTVLRSIDMQPLAGVSLDECFTNQVLTVGALKMLNQVSKQISDAAFTVVQRVNKDPKPLDLIMLLLVFSSNSSKKKNVETLLKNRIKSGFYRPSLLNAFYYNYKEVARDLQSTAIPVACHLLKAGDRVHAEYGIEWFRLLLLSQAEAIHKQQEVLAKIIKLTGAGTKTSKNALAILNRMSHNDEEREHLQRHSHHLRILLEEVDELDLEEVATVSDLLHGLCMSSNSTSDTLQDDLHIVLSKQLAGSNPVTKCKGVLGALMAIKHSASYPRTSKRALQLFELVVKAVKSCSRARALFYDQMAEVVTNTKNLGDNFLELFTEHFTAELTSFYLSDVKDYSGPLSAQFSLNSEVECPPEQEYGVNFGEGKNGSAVSALFKLIKACYSRREDGDLSSIDALLACPVFMSKDLNDPNAAVLDQMFHCINWFREIISGFVTQTDRTMEIIVLKRLDHLMTLQGELSMNLAMAPSNYQPPVCYFHHFPSPPFIKIEKKVGKRGNKAIVNKSQSLSEWSSWESGSLLVRKNPAYFRRLDARIAHLLDFSMETRLSQSKPNSITIAQVCFIIKELLGMLEDEVSQTFMKDLVNLLPKVCIKLDQVTNELRERTDSQNMDCLRLLLCFLAAIFNWKGFHNFVNNQMLREGLRLVASQIDTANTLLRSCKELVTQSCTYIESLVDVATCVSVAIALVNLYQALIQHSKSLAQQHKASLAKMAFRFLCLGWSGDKSNVKSYKLAITTLLKSWLTNEPDPLDNVITVLNWLPEEAKKLSGPQDSLTSISSINKNTFNILFKQIFVGMYEGIKISLASLKRDSERIQMWDSVATCVQKMVKICKVMELKANWLLFLQRFPILLKFFIDVGMPVLEHNLKYHMEEVTGIVKHIQEGTRYLHVLCCHATVTSDTTLVKFVPIAKSTLEKLVFSVKGMLVLNNSPEAFWMGNLINKDIKGQPIEMKQNTEESTAISADSVQIDVSEELLTDISDESANEDIE